MPNTLSWFRNLGAAVLALTSVGVAQASLVTVTLDGHLTSVPSQVAGAFTTGELFSFSYTYDTTTGNVGNTTDALYYYQSAHLDIGSGAFTLDAPAGAFFANGIDIVNEPSFDVYKVNATDGLVYSPSAAISPYTLVQVLAQFSYGPSEFSGPALLPGAPPYTPANAFSLELRPDPQSLDGRIFVDGSLDSATDNVQIPEPAGLALLLPALTTLGRLRRRRAA